MFEERRVLLLDMNGTFMFGEDRFGAHEDFSIQYQALGGVTYTGKINTIIRSAYDYLDERYLDKAYQNQFPSLECAILKTLGEGLEREELARIVATFAHHELGYIPVEYVNALRKLQHRFVLAAVIDIWAPKALWIDAFREAGILDLFSCLFFSSDHGIVKPSPKPFEFVLSAINARAGEAIMIGDSPRRDLGGAKNAGIDCILVGGDTHPDAMMCLDSLLDFSNLV